MTLKVIWYSAKKKISEIGQRKVVAGIHQGKTDYKNSYDRLLTQCTTFYRETQTHRISLASYSLGNWKDLMYVLPSVTSLTHTILTTSINQTHHKNSIVKYLSE